MTEPHVYHASDVEWQAVEQFDGVSIQLFVSAADTEAASMMRGRVAPGGEIPRHIHPVETELVYVLSGTATLTMDEQTYEVVPGSIMLITPGTPHSVFNHSSEVFEIIAVHTPPNR